MRGLSLTQPWATAVALGAKRIETRSWPTKYRGPVAIHAAKGFPRWAIECCFAEPFRGILRDGAVPTPGVLPRGAIVAIATLAECYAFTPDNRIWELGTPYERQVGDYAPGRFGFVLTDIVRLETPIPCRGALGLWEVPTDILEQITREGAHA